MQAKGKRKWIETTIPLVLTPGTEKQKYIRKAQAKITAFANQLLLYRNQATSLTRFHNLVYKQHRYLGIQSQVQEAVQRRVYAAKRPKKFQHIPLEFNFPRSGNLTYTTRGNPILKISPLKKRIAIPIKRNGGWQRAQDSLRSDWEPHSCLVFKKKKLWTAHLIFRKPLPPPQEVEGTIGVDIGIKIAAAITLNNPNFPLVEQYLGKDVVWKQHQFLKRRAVLQKYSAQGDVRARRALARLKDKEKNFTQTRCAQIAHGIVNLAVLTRSAIIIENIKHIRKKWTKNTSKSKKGAKKLRRQLNKWPFWQFLYILNRLAQLNNIPVISINPHYTSQTCSRCGKKNKRSRKTRDEYHCISCGFTVNADRNASRNIALLGLQKQGLPVYSSWRSYLPVPHERRNQFSSVSVVEVRSTISSGTMSGSVPVD